MPDHPVLDIALKARLAAVASLQVAAWVVLEVVSTRLTHVKPTWALHLALATISFEIASGSLALWLSGAPRLSVPLPLVPPKLSVLVAAYNEAGGIEATVRSILEQTRVVLEVIVADDGSRDATAQVVAEAFGADARVRLLALPHRGKGTALNAAIAAARHPVVVTVDADTLLAPLALARLATAFEDPDAAAAAGSVLLARTPNLLTRFQQIEYVRNTVIRQAWASLSALEQLPGAFMALRTDWVKAAGGYPTQSLTEDYELVYRLYARAAREGRPLQIRVVPTACAYTEAPSTLAALMRQRTRWFAGFLTTLIRFRGLIGNPRAGVFGVVKLPIKVLDAIHPPLSLLSLLILAAGFRSPDVRPLAIALFWLRWAWDSWTLAMAVRFARRAGAELDLGRADSAWPWLFVLADGLSYFWLRQLAVLRSYAWAVRSPRTESWRPIRAPIPSRADAA